RQFGLVETDDADGRLRRFREKPTAEEEITTNTINAGIYLIDAPLLARIPPDRPSSIEREFFPALIAEGITSYGWCPRTYWRDLGDPVAYRAGNIDLREGRANMPLSPPGERRGARAHRPRGRAGVGRGRPGRRDTLPLRVVGAATRRVRLNRWFSAAFAISRSSPTSITENRPSRIGSWRSPVRWTRRRPSIRS